MFAKSATAFVAALAMLVLAACGGGSSVSGSPDPTSLDTLLLGDVLVATQGHLFRADSSCEGTVCTVTFDGGGESVTFDLRGIEPSSGAGPPADEQTRNGVQIGRLVHREDNVRFDTLGVWGRYNIGTTGRGSADIEGTSLHIVVPVSLGHGTGTNPVLGSATWRGVMVGAKVGPAGVGADVTGDAAMIADLDASSLDLAFTNIEEQSSGARSEDIRWQDVPMQSGAFNASGLQGRFYGPNHEEAGGVFERSGIAGAFSLARQ